MRAPPSWLRRPPAPNVLPKCRYRNGLLTHLATQHYLYGTTMGQLEKQAGIGVGSIVDALHPLARRLGTVPDRLLDQYRRAAVKHADETGWRTDGGNGYAWLFATPDVSLFRFWSTQAVWIGITPVRLICGRIHIHAQNGPLTGYDGLNVRTVHSA